MSGEVQRQLKVMAGLSRKCEDFGRRDFLQQRSRKTPGYLEEMGYWCHIIFLELAGQLPNGEFQGRS